MKLAQLQLETIKNLKGPQPKLSRDCDNNCKIEILNKDCMLKNYIEELNITPYNEQKPMPNPTLVDGKFITFTAYSVHKFPSFPSPPNDQENLIFDSHYPTLYFHDIAAGKLDWEIFGAEMFADFDAKNKQVTFVTNEAWTTK